MYKMIYIFIWFIQPKFAGIVEHTNCISTEGYPLNECPWSVTKKSDADT